MKRFAKRLLSLLIVAVMVCTMLPVTALAAECTGAQLRVMIAYYDANNGIGYSTDYDHAINKVFPCVSVAGNHSSTMHMIQKKEIHPDTLGLTQYVREGYEWKGWYLGTSNKNDVANPRNGTFSTSDTSTFSDAASTVILVYHPELRYTLSYDLKGGSDIANFPAQSAKPEWGSAVITIYSGQPTKENCTFKGWDTSSAATNVVKNPGDSISITKNTTLYAVWEAVVPPAPVEPEAPNSTEVIEAMGDSAVTVNCTNEDVEHAAAFYALNSNTFTVGNVYEDNGTYKVDVAVTSTSYVSSYNQAMEADHTPATETKSFTMTYDGTEWVKDTGVTFEVVCENPEPPAPVEPEAPGEDKVDELLAGKAVTIDCTNEEVTHANKTYGVLDGSYEMGEVEGDATSGYTVAIRVTPSAYVTQYNTDMGATHTLSPEDQGEKTITLTYADGEWTAGDGVTYTVECETPEPPAVTYTVTYNDGVEGDVVFQDQVYTVEEGDPTPDFVGTPTRQGYDFTGWRPQVAETVTRDDTYRAQWVQNNRHATVNIIPVTKNENGQGYVKIGEGIQKVLNCTNTGACNGRHLVLHRDIHPDLNDLKIYAQYAGYEFTGWDSAWSGGFSLNTNKAPRWNADGLQTNDTSTYAVSTNDTVYIVYTKGQVEPETKTHTLIYNANCEDAVINVPANESQTTTADSYVFVIATAELDREGYTFKGWADSATATEAVYEVGDEITVSGEKTIYAVWEAEIPPAVTYTVTYTDGVENEEIFADEVYNDVLSGTATPTFNDGENPTRDGYMFTGWEPEVADTVTADATYTATWAEDENGNGIVDDEEEKYTVTYTDGVKDAVIFDDQVTSNLLPGTDTPAFVGEEPEREDHVFYGWNPAVAETVTETVTYTAKWEVDSDGNGVADKDEEKYTVTYTDGVLGKVVFSDQVYEDILSGSDTPEFRGTPRRKGYVFDGWNPEVAETVTENVTYEAQWARDTDGDGTPDRDEKKYTVKYTDGVFGKEVFKTQVYDDLLYGARTPEFRGRPFRAGYVFAGWEPEVAGRVTKNVTYEAQWDRDRNGNGVADKNENGGSSNKGELDSVPKTGDRDVVIMMGSLLFVVCFGTTAFWICNRKRNVR